MKALTNNKTLFHENFILIQNWFNHPIELESNLSKSYIYIASKKEKRYTLKDNNALTMRCLDDLFFWPYKNLVIHTKEKFGLKII